VNSKLHEATNQSKTLYVDLLNPGGEVIEKKVLEINNGQCSGEFTLNSTVFYSGFFEVRAYTKYMLNFGEDAIFSRVFPVFDEPKAVGDYSDRKMQKDVKNYRNNRKKPHKDKKVNVVLFPEGGNLIDGLESQVAFQATDELGNPIEVTGTITDGGRNEVSRFSTIHDGRGVFLFTPSSTDKKLKTEVSYKGKKYEVNMPESLPQGYVMKVDNLSDQNNIEVSINKNANLPADILGAVTICRGEICSFNIVDFRTQNETRFDISKEIFPSGIAQVILFDQSGKILCDRLVFINKGNYLTIVKEQEKNTYNPYELVNMEFAVKDKGDNPVSTSFSLSVKDAANEIIYTDNVQTNILLSSEIKGYIHNPSYYFEADDAEHRQALDLLLMVQGWRRYVWGQMAGIEPFEIKYIPEQGVEIRGQVRSSARKKIKPNIDVSLFLKRTDENDKQLSEVVTGKSDSMGQFRIISGLYGKWDMSLSLSEKGKKKNDNITLDRLFRPKPKRYTYPELQVLIADEKKGSTEDDGENLDENNLDMNAFLPVLDDSIGVGMDQRIHHLKEVTVTAKGDNDDYRTTSVANYDVSSEINDILDDGGFVGEDIYDFLININPDFYWEIEDGEMVYKYRGKRFLIVRNRSQSNRGDVISTIKSENSGFGVNNGSTQEVFDHFEGIDIGKITRLNAVKSIYINKDYNVISKYVDSKLSIHDIMRRYSCVVFIETYPDTKIPNGAKGIRKLKLEGYDLQKEFYSPDYSILPKEVDYRRTLYWNPDVSTNSEGKARVQFYNNSTCRQMIISAETITPDGLIGVYADK